MMNAAAVAFESNQSRLFAVAYRVLGSRTEAEDILQDAYLNWSQCAAESLQSTTAFLVTITKHLCFDRIRKLKNEREQAIECWVPESIVEDEVPSPESQLELAEEASMAFLAAVERLGPEELAAFLLHDVFDYDYPEVAQMLDKTEAACRQIIHRARARVRDPRVRYSVTAQSRQRLLERFVVAIRTGERRDVMALIAEDVEYVDVASPAVVVMSYAVSRRGRVDGSVPHCFAGAD